MKCHTKFCRNSAAPGRTRCHKCRSRSWRARNPIRYLYGNTKHHAKQRGKLFTLTFDQWRDFCEKTQYHVLKGRDAVDYTIDRIDPPAGYSEGNIRVLTHHENSVRQDAPPEEAIA